VIYEISRKIPTNGVPLVTAGSNRGIQFVPFGGADHVRDDAVSVSQR
jgi:hypothetical protein